MTLRTYFKINRAHMGQEEYVVIVDGLVPIPPPGTRVEIDHVRAEVISSMVEISQRSKLYEQTIFCNGRS